MTTNLIKGKVKKNYILYNDVTNLTLCRYYKILLGLYGYSIDPLLILIKEFSF